MFFLHTVLVYVMWHTWISIYRRFQSMAGWWLRLFFFSSPILAILYPQEIVLLESKPPSWTTLLHHRLNAYIRCWYHHGTISWAKVTNCCAVPPWTRWSLQRMRSRPDESYNANPAIIDRKGLFLVKCAAGLQMSKSRSHLNPRCRVLEYQHDWKNVLALNRVMIPDAKQKNPWSFSYCPPGRQILWKKVLMFRGVA